MGWMPRPSDWQELPGRFFVTGFVWVVAVEFVGSWWTGSGNPVPALIVMRLAEAGGLLLLLARLSLMQAAGLSRPGPRQWRLFLILSLISALAFALVLALSQALDLPLLRHLGVPAWIQGWSGVLLMLLLAPLAEELFFRALVYRLFRQAFGIPLAIVLSAICFALMHGQLLSPQLLGGLIFAVAYEWGRNLWIAVALHAGANAAVLLLNL